MNERFDRLEGIRTRIVRVVRESTGLHEQFAMPIASKILETFLKEFGGERVYMPSRDEELAQQVRQEYDGDNRDELCKRHRISRATFYRYVKKEGVR